MGQDIRNFFKTGSKPGGAPPSAKAKQEAKTSQEPKAKAKPAAAAAANKAASPAKKSSPAAGSHALPADKGRDGQQTESRKRKKTTVIDSDSDVEIVDDDADSDEDFDAMSLDEELDDDVITIDDDSEEDVPKPKPAKRAKPSPAAAAAAAPAPAKAGAAAAGAAKGKGRGKKAEKPAMVIEKSTQGTAEKKRKLPGSMAGQTATLAAAPKSAAKAKKAAAGSQLSDQAKSAMAMVDAAAAQLPELEKDSLSFAPSGMFGGVKEERLPPNPDSKDVVSGHPDAFTGKTFVFSGVLSSLFRDTATDLVLSHGGRVTGDVSGKTSFLVVGDQCSRRKYEKALEKGCRVIDEDGLLALTAASASLVPSQQQHNAAAPDSHPAAAAAAAGGPQHASQQQWQQQVPGAGSGGTATVPKMSAVSFHGHSARGPAAAAAAGAGAGPSRAAAAAAAGGGAASGRPAGCGIGDSLWVEKYKPHNASELVGNNAAVATLKQWMHQWEDVHLRGATPQQPRGSTSKPKDMSKKAVLLAGPPGIGKTSSAHIIARELGYQVVEVNASDARNKSDNKASSGIGGKMSNVVREMVTSTALAAASGIKRRQLLVMDEVDGMSAGDRGGVADLINTIKMSKIPIICICNDKYSQKLRSLRNHCVELDFRRPTSQQIAARMALVCRNEGLAINEATLRTLIDGAQGDLRLVLGQLQMARLRATSLDYNAAKAMSAVSKDADMSPFSACSKLFEFHPTGATARPPSVTDKLEWVFADADLVPLLVQENYVNYVPELTRSLGKADQALGRLRAMAKAADGISIGDVVNVSVRRYGNWGLMPFGAMMGSVMPATYMSGVREIFEPHEQNFTRFSAWFGNNSHGNKQHRLLAELSCAMAAGDTGATCSRSSVRLDYLPALRQVLTRPLQLEGEAAIPTVINTMQSYCINREQFDYVLDVTKFKTKAAWGDDPMKEVETKTKSAFTRTFNKQGLKPRTSAMVPDVNTRGAKGKGKGRGKAAAAGDDDEELVEAVAADAEGGAALAEEGGPPRQQARRSEEAEEEGLTPEQLAARMQQDGIVLQLKPQQGAAKSGRGGASGGGRGRGAGRSGGASGRGSRSGGGGRGRGK